MYKTKNKHWISSYEFRTVNIKTHGLSVYGSIAIVELKKANTNEIKNRLYL